MAGQTETGSSHYGDGVVVEHGRDIFRGELVGGVADEQTCLANRTVADNDAPGEKDGLAVGNCVYAAEEGVTIKHLAYLIVATTMARDAKNIHRISHVEARNPKTDEDGMERGRRRGRSVVWWRVEDVEVELPS